MIGRTCAAAQASKTYVSVLAIFDRIRSVVALGDRVAHLEALSHIESQKVPDYELAQAIARCIDHWRAAPSIEHWCRERLMRVVVDLLPGFSRWLVYGQSPLPALLEKSGVPGHQICAALLEGMERHVDALDAPIVYALIGLVGRYCAPDDAVQVMARYCENRSFHFDILDTLPYWYSRALEVFGDLDREEFLDAAERWIVDRWGVQSNPWRWDDEPRQHSFSDHAVASMHSNGSLPILERFHTYLEWHAMWCATGELMQTHALAKAGEDDL